MLPTLVINNVQYRGKLERNVVLKAICVVFKETTEPSICLRGDMETNECLTNNGGCWQDTTANITACKDIFRGRVCQCPQLSGVQFDRDGYTYCEGLLLAPFLSTFSGELIRVTQSAEFPISLKVLEKEIYIITSMKEWTLLPQVS